MKRIIAITLTLCLLLLTACSVSTKSNYTFDETSFPKVGVTVSTEEIGKAVAATVLSKNVNEVEDFVQFSNSTLDAYKALCDGELDILIAFEPDEETSAYIKESGKDLEMTAVGVDALIMICSEKNDVDSLTENEINGIYSGRITNWNEVGGKKGTILPYQNKSGSAEQELFNRTLNMGDRLKTATEDLIIDSSGRFMSSEAIYDNSKNAVGYTTFRKYELVVDGLSSNTGTVKILSVNDIAPTRETIASGEYPLCENIYVVIRKTALNASAERVLYNWICSQQGREVISKY